MKIGSPCKARIKERPGRLPRVLCGVTQCGTEVGEVVPWCRPGRHLDVGRVLVDWVASVHLRWGFERDGAGNYQLSNRAARQWRDTLALEDDEPLLNLGAAAAPYNLET